MGLKEIATDLFFIVLGSFMLGFGCGLKMWQKFGDLDDRK